MDECLFANSLPCREWTGEPGKWCVHCRSEDRCSWCAAGEYTLSLIGGHLIDVTPRSTDREPSVLCSRCFGYALGHLATVHRSSYQAFADQPARPPKAIA